MIEPTLFIQISYALGAGLIVFGTPCLLAGGAIFYILKRLEGGR